MAGPFADLPRIGSGCVDDMFAPDRAELRLDDPLAVLFPPDIRRPAAANNLGAQLARPRRKRLGNPCRIGMAVIRRMQRADHPFQIIERVQFSDPVRPDKFGVETKRARHAGCMAQPIHLVFGIGEAEGPAAVPRHRLARFLFQGTGIKVDIVTDAFPYPEGTGRLGNLPGGMPG